MTANKRGRAKDKREETLPKGKNEKSRTKKNSTNRRSNNQSAWDAPQGQFIPVLLLFLIGVVPLIIFCKLQTFVSPAIDPGLKLSTTDVTDFFTYYKEAALLLIAGLILIIFLFKIFSTKTDLKASTVDIPVLALILALALSLLTADYKSIALWGGFGRNFGVISYLACIIVFFVIIKTRVNNLWIKTWFAYALGLVTVVNVVMMTLTFYGHDLSQSNFFIQLITGGRPDLFPKGTIIEETVSHKNYISGLGGIFFAFFAGKAVLESGQWQRKPFNILMAGLSAVMVYIAAALSGAVTMALAVAMTLILAIEKGKRSSIFSWLGVMGTTTAFWLILAKKNNAFMNELTQSGEDKGLILATIVLALFFMAVYELVKNWSRLNKKIVIGAGSVFLLLCIAASFMILPKVYTKVNNELDRISTGKMMERLAKDEFDFPEPQFTWGTGRIYIWKEALKLVGQRPLFGYGLDTLSYYLNPGDPAKVPAMDSPNVIIDKPHNTYVNLLFGTGIVTFLAFVAVIIMVLKKTLKASFRARPEIKALLWPLILGAMAYLYQSMFNDPIQGIEPIFWVILGLSYNLAEKEIESIAK